MSDSLLDQASVARLNGDDQTAIEICRKLLAAEPDNVDAMSMLGVSLAETSQLDEARRLIKAALEAAPDNWRFLLNQSVLLENEGDLAAALQAAQQAGVVAPDTFEVWGRVGDLSGKQGNFALAAEALTKAISINPDHPPLALRAAGACFEIGDYQHASDALDCFEKFAPGHPHALRLRTHIARQTSNWEGLIESASAWLKASPDEEAARVALAFAYAQPGFFARAVEAYKPLADATPPKADHLSTLGRYLLSARDLDGAEDYFRRALDLEHDHSEAKAGLSRLMTFLGRFEEAAELSRQALKADPQNVEAFGQLALATGARFSEEEIERLQILGRDEDLQLEHRALCLYAAGDGFHRRKIADAAFGAWAKASSLKMSLAETDADARYDPAGHEKSVDRLIRVFDYDPPASDAELARRPAPIFIVGMPRSGTTLLESALAAHRDVTCAGELPVMPFAQREFDAWADQAGWKGGEIPKDIIDAIRQKYFDQYREYGIDDAPFITDKQPNNFLVVGLIRHVFPEARIIHIRRNPMETGFSIFRRNFTRPWQFANSLSYIGHYYGQHSRIASHWSKILGPEMAFIQYEDLVTNFETELRRLIGFCGLEWDANCLEYYKEERAVITFSAAQVRKPPSVEHLNSTDPYLQFLKPLKTSLEQAGIDLETGALISDSGN